jgi:hypothetical protein
LTNQTKKIQSLGSVAPTHEKEKVSGLANYKGACAMTLWETEIMDNVPQQVGNQGRKSWTN